MQIKVKPANGQHLEIQLDDCQLNLPEQECRQIRDALFGQLEQFALHPTSRWERARQNFQQLQPVMAHLEQFNNNELALLMREFDFTLLYRVAQSKQMGSLLEKLEQALGRREVDRIALSAEKLPLKPLWEVNERIQALVRTIERMTDEGEIRPPRMTIKPAVTTGTTDSTERLAGSADDSAFVRQVLSRLEHFPDKILFVIFKRIPPRELAKLWRISEQMSAAGLLYKFKRLIPEPARQKLASVRPATVTPEDARKNAQLIVELIKSLQHQKK